MKLRSGKQPNERENQKNLPTPKNREENNQNTPPVKAPQANPQANDDQSQFDLQLGLSR